MADSIKISLELADKAAQKSLSDFLSKAGSADKSVNKLQKSFKDTFSDIAVSIGKSNSVFEIFQGNLAANVVTGAFNKITQAAGAAFDLFVIDGVKAAAASEAALRSLNVALAQAGNYSLEASEDFKTFAEEIQRTTAFEDDAIIANAALLESLTRLDVNGLKRVSSAAIELSAALGQDLETVTRALAKASDGNTTALKKMGVEFEEAGSKAATFENVLSAIEKNLGGTAAKNVQTFSGSITQAKNAFGDLQEESGALIAQNPAIIAAIVEITKIFQELKTSLSLNSKEIAETVGETFVLIINLSANVVRPLDAIVTAGIVMSKVLSYNVVGAFETLKAYIDGGALDSVAKKLDQIGVSAQTGLDKLKTGGLSAAPALQNATKATDELTEAQERSRKELNNYVTDLAKKNDSVKESYDAELESLRIFYETKDVQESEAEAVNYQNKLIREQAYTEEKLALLDERLIQENLRISQSTVDDETANKARLAAQQQYFAQKEKLELESAKRRKALLDAERIQDQKYNEAKIQATADVFGSIARVAALGGKKNFEIVKAFNLAEAITAGILAVQKAAASAPPPFNIPAIVSAAALNTANVAQIVATQPPSFEEGGIVPGTSFTGDRVAANVNSGEMVLTRQQQAELFRMANGGGSDRGLAEEVRALSQVVMGLLAQPMVVQVDGKELFNITRAQLASGRAY